MVIDHPHGESVVFQSVVLNMGCARHSRTSNARPYIAGRWLIIKRQLRRCAYCRGGAYVSENWRLKTEEWIMNIVRKRFILFVGEGIAPPGTVPFRSKPSKCEANQYFRNAMLWPVDMRVPSAKWRTFLLSKAIDRKTMLLPSGWSMTSPTEAYIPLTSIAF